MTISWVSSPTISSNHLPRVTCSPSCSWQPQLVSPWPRCHRATRRFIGQVCCHHLGWQCHPVLHRLASVSIGKGHQSCAYTEQDDAGGIDGTLHEEFRSHPASHHEHSGNEDGRIQQGFSIRIVYLHHHQHEWMCSIHPRHLPILDAERRHSAVIIYHDTLAFHLRPVSGGQCWCPNGLLFSDPLPDVGHERSYRHHGHHPAYLYHHRYDRDG